MNPICAEGNLMQESEPPADKRQRFLCTSAASAACSTTTGIPFGVALHESIAIACVPSVSEQNQLLPKPLCLGYLPDVPAPFVHNWAFAAHYVWSYHFLDHMESIYASRSKERRLGSMPFAKMSI